MSRKRRSVRQERFVPPDVVEEQLASAEAAVAAKTHRRPESRGTERFLVSWASLVDRIGTNRPHSADDYLHSIGYRIRLQNVIDEVHALDSRPSNCRSSVIRLSKRRCDDVELSRFGYRDRLRGDDSHGWSSRD